MGSHNHHHHHHHDEHEIGTLSPQLDRPAQAENVVELDPGAKSLSDALRMSFRILKLIMAVLVVIFIASAFFTVGVGEEALVLRFGKITGMAEERIRQPGSYLAFPFDEVVKIPAKKVQTMQIDNFWWAQTEDEKVSGQKGSAGPTLNPETDGYCLTRNDSTSGITGNDYNIVHCKWQVSYSIGDTERFFKNVWVKPTQRGQNYGDVMNESVSRLIQSLTSNAIVTTMVNYSIDEAIQSRSDIAADVRAKLQDKLDAIGSGIKVMGVQLTYATWPRQVDNAFVESIKARQRADSEVKQALGYAASTLTEAGGPVAEEILAQLQNPSQTPAQQEDLWKQLAGSAQEKIASAQAYRTSVVESAKANADYMQKLLPEYVKRPQLVVQKIYQDAVEAVLDNADEKMIVQPGGKDHQVRIQINRDPAIKKNNK